MSKLWPFGRSGPEKTDSNRAGKRRWGRKGWAAVVVAALVVAGGAGWWLMTRDGSSQAATGTSTTTVSSGTVKETVSADGTVDAADTEDLDFEVSGTVTKVYVAEGDKVTKGQALARIDDSTLVATRKAAAATLDAAEEQLDTDEDDDASDTQLAADRSSILSAKADLASAREDVRDAVLRATITGTVASLDLEVGDVVGSSGSSDSSDSTGSTDTSTDTSSDSTSSSAVTLITSKKFIVDATVSADDADNLKKGLQAEITVNGSTDPIYGTVSEVGAVAETNSSGAAVFPVTIAVTGKQSDLYAGTSATATITVKQRSNVLTVASQAIKTDGDTAYVMKMVNGKAVKTTVKVGQVYGTTTEIKSGLKEGDTVQITGFTMQGGGESGGTASTGTQEGFGSGNMPSGSLPGGSGGFPGGGQ
ncbi:MAG: HlyD family efflux transporter periplasmic adaptor subunit [Nocardioides sp.]|uniref:efflux RND transporter periplasmic adaptor subunit n=1 Tax=Nocardioides sp. TaxID=35761 RepID=UPI0039E71E89